MNRLQFWKKDSKKKDASEKKPLEASFAEAYKENGHIHTTETENGLGCESAAAEPLCQKNPSAAEGPRDVSESRDPGPSVDSGDPVTEWPRDQPSLSFETFKGPQLQAAPSAAETDRDLERAVLLPRQQTPSTSFEVIYSQVNKNKQGRPVPGDRTESPKASGSVATGEVSTTDRGASKQEDMPRGSDVSALSFDDVLESFEVSLNDLQALADSVPSLSSPRDGGGAAGKVGDLQDNYVEIEAVNSGPIGGTDRGAMDNYGVDVDLMMSDEIIVRPRKKSVTFNERIQERPLSIGESDITNDDVTPSDDVTDHVAGRNGFIPNGIEKPPANGVTHQNGHIANHTYPYTGEDAEITEIKHYVTKERELDRLVQPEGRDRLTSLEQLTNEEEDLLEAEPIKIRRLLYTRTLILIFAWISMAIMSEAVTTSFPVTHTYLNVSMEMLSRAHITHGAGCVLSAILTAILSTYLACDMFVWVVVGVVVLTTAAVWLPWCASMAMVLTFYGLTGCGEFMIMMASVYLVIQLWSERRRDAVIHVLFVCKAAAAALVPHIVRVLGPLLGTWSLPGLTYNVSKNVSSGAEVGVANGTTLDAENDYDDYVITIISVHIPVLFPVYLVLSVAGVVAVVLLCVVLGYKQCQVSKRNDMERKVKKIRKKKMKQQIKLVGLQDVHLDAKFNTKAPNGTAAAHNSKKNEAIRIEIQEVLSQVHDIRRTAHVTGNTHVEDQVAKLLEYANYLHSQGDISDTTDDKTQSASAKCRSTWLQGNQTFGVDSQLYLYVFFTLAGGLTMTLSQFLYIYAHERMIGDFGFEDDLVFTLYWGSIAVSRLIAFPVSRLVSPNAIMITCLVTNMSSSAIMLAYADRFPVLLWLFGGLLGASVGPILPGGLTWANIYFNLTRPKALGLVFVFWGLGAMLFPWCCGFVIHNWGLSAMFYMTVVTAGLAFLLYIPVLIAFSRREIYNIASKRSSISSAPMRTYL